jgi:hypothetical protein
MSSVIFLLVLSLFIDISGSIKCKNDPYRKVARKESHDSGNYKVLDLSGCGNDRMENDGDFKDRDYLKAYSNVFSKLEANTFIKIPNLVIIDLHDNQIEEISREAFTGLSKLTDLYLNHNSIEELKVGAFDPLVALETLKLQHNKIKVLMEGIFDKNPNLKHCHFDENQIFAVGPTVLKSGVEWNLTWNTCVDNISQKNDTNLEQTTKKCVENYKLYHEMCIFFDFFSNSQEGNSGDDKTNSINNAETTENFEFNFLSIILAGLFMISLLLNVIQFVRTKRVTQTQATIPSPANEPVTYYLTMNAETVGARSLKSPRPNNDRVEVTNFDNGEAHVYDVLKEGNKN